MVGIAKACPGGTALFHYVVSDKKGYELTRNGLSGITPKELYTDMLIFQQQNLRCTNNTISMVLSPTISDGINMSDNQLKQLTEDFLTEMELDPNSRQYIAFVHSEKAHKHVHILMNRVKMDGTLIKDSFISKNAQEAAHLVALKHGLTSAKILKETKENQSKSKNLEIKKTIKKAHYKVLMMKPDTLETYKEGMLKFDIEVLPTINKQGNIQGYRFNHKPTETNLKASEVDRNLKLNKLFTNGNSRALTRPEEGISLPDWKLDMDILNTIPELFSSNEEADPYEDIDENKKRKRKGRRRKF